MKGNQKHIGEAQNFLSFQNRADPGKKKTFIPFQNRFSGSSTYPRLSVGRRRSAASSIVSRFHHPQSCTLYPVLITPAWSLILTFFSFAFQVSSFDKLKTQRQTNFSRFAYHTEKQRGSGRLKWWLWTLFHSPSKFPASFFSTVLFCSVLRLHEELIFCGVPYLRCSRFLNALNTMRTFPPLLLPLTSPSKAKRRGTLTRRNGESLFKFSDGSWFAAWRSSVRLEFHLPPSSWYLCRQRYGDSCLRPTKVGESNSEYDGVGVS